MSNKRIYQSNENKNEKQTVGTHKKFFNLNLIENEILDLIETSNLALLNRLETRCPDSFVRSLICSIDLIALDHNTKTSIETFLNFYSIYLQFNIICISLFPLMMMILKIFPVLYLMRRLKSLLIGQRGT